MTAIPSRIPSSLTPTTSSLGAMGAPVKSTSAGGSISSDFNTFLTLLTAQLRNQDPLDPMNPSDFTNQLTQLSQLEQAAAQTESLATITGAVGGLAARLDAGLLGQRVEIASDMVTLMDASAGVSFVLDAPAEQVVVDIMDASGRVVAQLSGETGAGPQHVSWDGRTAEGVVMPDGAYTASVRAISGGVERPVTPLTVGVVQEVRFSEGGVYALLDTGTWTPLAGARAVAAP